MAHTRVNFKQPIYFYKKFINSMKNLRTYGNAPFQIAVIHGGPGAPGSMGPVARNLSMNCGVLEPLQTASSIEGQIRELQTVLREQGVPPFTLIGSSWGAMLGFVFTAQYPEFVKKLILIGSGVYEEKYAAGIQGTRLSRLSQDERREAFSLLEIINDPTVRDKSKSLAKLGLLFTKADAYNPMTLDTEVIDVQYQLHQSVWKDASELRSSGAMLALGKKIECPVVAIHGDYDPHPAEGVQKPLSRMLKNFRFILIEHCGHLPWIEQEAHEKFYRILREELADKC